jgi:hypothetical protein
MTYNFETGEFSFVNNPVNHRPSPFAGPSVQHFRDWAISTIDYSTDEGE